MIESSNNLYDLDVETLIDIIKVFQHEWLEQRIEKLVINK